MSDDYSDETILRLRAQCAAAAERFESGAWLDDLAGRTGDTIRAAKLLFEQERLRLETLRADLAIATERRKFDLRVALRTGTASYDTRLWGVKPRVTAEFDVERLRADYPELPEGAIKTSHTVVRRKLPIHVEVALPQYEISRTVTYVINSVGQGSDDGTDE